MATGDERDLIEAVVTCEGNLHDPDFQERFRELVAKLKSALYISKTKDPFRVRKIEPWNSVRVTISIPKEAAQKLKLLAQQGSNVLRSMGILSVQVEGDQVISLTWASQNNEPTQVLIRQPNDEGASSSGTSGVSTSSLPASSPSISSISSSAASISSPVSLTPGSSGEVSGMAAALDMLSSSPATLAFRSPNVVAPSGEAIPVLPPKSLGAGVRQPFGGPFPFVSMTHAAQAIHRTEQSPVLNSNNVVVSVSGNISGSNAANSTNNIASSIPSSALLQGAINKSVQSPQGYPTTAVSNNPLSSGGTPVIVSTAAGNILTTVNVNSDQHVTRLIIENTNGLASAMAGGNAASLGHSVNSNLAISQAGPSQSLQLHLVNVPPPYPGVSTISSNSLNSSSSNPSGAPSSSVQVRHPQPQTSLMSNIGGSAQSPLNMPTITMVSTGGESQALIGRPTGGTINEVPSIAPVTNFSDSPSGVSPLSQPVSSPLLVNLLQNNDALPSSSTSTSSAPSQEYSHQLQQKNPSAESPQGRFLLQQQQLKKTKRGLSMDGACSQPVGGSEPILPATIPQAPSASDSFQFALPLPSDNTSTVTMNRVNIPVASQNKVGGSPLSNQKPMDPSSPGILHGRTIVQGNIRILDQGSGQLRTIPLQPHPPPPPYPSQGKDGVSKQGQMSTASPTGVDLLTTLANGPLLASTLSQMSEEDDVKSQTLTMPHASLVQLTDDQRMDASKVPTSPAADQSRTSLPITTVNIISKSTSKPSTTTVNFNSKESDSKTFIPPPDPRLSSQVQKMSQSGSNNPVSMKNSASSLVVQTAIYNSDAKSPTSQLNSLGRPIPGIKRSAKPFHLGPVPPTGKPRQFLINPLTGHLEPMLTESSSESEEGDDGDPEGRKANSHKGSPLKHKARATILSPAIHHRQIVTTESGVTVARVVKGSIGPESAQSHRESDGKKAPNSSGDIVSAPLGFGTSVMSVTKKSKEDTVTNAALYSPKDAKDTSPATVTATSVSGEKIKLRLKLEKSEPISPAYKVDVSFVKKSEKSSMLPSPSSSQSGASSSNSTSSPSSNQSSPSDQPRVPPLHISLRGKNAAVVVSPRREEKEMPPPPSIFSGNTKDPLIMANSKDISISDGASTSSSSSSLTTKPTSQLLNSHDGKPGIPGSKASGNTKRVKDRVKSLDGTSSSKASTGDKLKVKTSRPKLNKELSRSVSTPMTESPKIHVEPTQNVQPVLPVTQSTLVQPVAISQVKETDHEEKPSSLPGAEVGANVSTAKLLPSNNNKLVDAFTAGPSELPSESDKIAITLQSPVLEEPVSLKEEKADVTVSEEKLIKDMPVDSAAFSHSGLNVHLDPESKPTDNPALVTTKMDLPQVEDVSTGAFSSSEIPPDPSKVETLMVSPIKPLEQNIAPHSELETSLKGENLVSPVVTQSPTLCDKNMDVEMLGQSVNTLGAEQVSVDMGESKESASLEEIAGKGAIQTGMDEQRKQEEEVTMDVVMEEVIDDKLVNKNSSLDNDNTESSGGSEEVQLQGTTDVEMQETIELSEIEKTLKDQNLEELVTPTVETADSDKTETKPVSDEELPSKIVSQQSDNENRSVDFSNQEGVKNESEVKAPIPVILEEATQNVDETEQKQSEEDLLESKEISETPTSEVEETKEIPQSELPTPKRESTTAHLEVKDDGAVANEKIVSESEVAFEVSLKDGNQESSAKEQTRIDENPSNVEEERKGEREESTIAKNPETSGHREDLHQSEKVVAEESESNVCKTDSTELEEKGNSIISDIITQESEPAAAVSTTSSVDDSIQKKEEHSQSQIQQQAQASESSNLEEDGMEPKVKPDTQENFQVELRGDDVEDNKEDLANATPELDKIRNVSASTEEVPSLPEGKNVEVQDKQLSSLEKEENNLSDINEDSVCSPHQEETSEETEESSKVYPESVNKAMRIELSEVSMSSNTASSPEPMSLPSPVPKETTEKRQSPIPVESSDSADEERPISTSPEPDVSVTIMTPKQPETPVVSTTNTPPISIVLPSDSVLRSEKGTPSKPTYKRRAEIKPGALQNTLKRLHDNFLPKVLKTSERQDVSSHRMARQDAEEEPSAPHVEPVKPTLNVIPKVAAPITTQPVSIAVSQVRPMPNIIHRPKVSTASATVTTQQALHQLPSGLQSNLLAVSSALTSVASLSVPSTSSSGPQTVFAIHPNVSIPANFAQLQQSPMVLPGGHKMVPIKLVTLPKQGGGQLQTIPIGSGNPSRSSPNLLEAVNIVANAGSRSSSPKTTLIGNAMQSTPLNLSSVSLPVGGNLHFVPISVSSGTGTTSNVKVLMTQPIKMQQAGLSQSMVVKSVLMGSQPTTIRVIRPLNLQEPIAIQTPIKQSEHVNEISKPKPETTPGPAMKTEFRIQPQPESFFKKLDGVEVVETGSPLNNDDLPFEADIIHDEKDLADILAAEAKNELLPVENCTNYNVTVRSSTNINKVSEKVVVKPQPTSSHSKPSAISSVPNHVTSKNLLRVGRDGKEESPVAAAQRQSAMLGFPGKQKNSRSPSPSIQSTTDLHGEDPEIINSFSSIPKLTNQSKSQPKETSGKLGGHSDVLPDHTYGLASATNMTNNVDEVLSIEIPSMDLEVASTFSPSQSASEERRCTRSTRSNTRLSPDITAFVSETPKPAKVSTKVEPLVLRNSPKPSPTGSLKVLSPTPSSLTITPSTSTRSSPILHSQQQVNAGNAAATINAVALGIIDKIQGNATAQNLKNSRISKLSGANKRKRQESDSSSASRDENNEEKAEIDLNSRPGKRKCSENAAEMIKVCIGVEDSPKRNLPSVKKAEESKLKDGKWKKGVATIAEDDDDADSEVSLPRGRSGRNSSRESSEDRSSSRGSSVQRVTSSTTTEKLKSGKEEETPKDAKSSRLNSRLKTQSERGSLQSNTPAKKAKESEKVVTRRPNGPTTKSKSPLTPAKTRTNVRKDALTSGSNSDKSSASNSTASSTPEAENARRKTRSSAASKRHVT